MADLDAMREEDMENLLGEDHRKDILMGTRELDSMRRVDLEVGGVMEGQVEEAVGLGAWGHRRRV